MDFQGFVDRIPIPCAVLRVERTPEGNCGAVRFHRANRAFRALHPGEFREDMLYNGGNSRDPRFEEFCFRAAFQGQRIHDYTEAIGLKGWGDISLVPLAREREDVGYCQFTIELTRAADPKRMAAVSQRTSTGVIRAVIMLRDGGDFSVGARRALEDILDSTGAIAGRMVRTSKERRTVTELVSCVRPDAPFAAGLDGLAPYEIITYADIERITRTVIVTNAPEMEMLARLNPALAERMRRFGVDSFLLTPLRRGPVLLGFLYLVNFNVRDVVEIKELVELDCFFLGLELSNRSLLARLEKASVTDELTGLRNRHAMLERLHADSGKRYGVFNVDLNGLKTVNDNDGHEAGDRLLRSAAALLTEVFDRADVFRTGGDEFIILCEGLSEAAFREKREALEGRRAACGFSFALGAVWSDGSVPVAEALRRADEQMYADKREFYALHGHR